MLMPGRESTTDAVGMETSHLRGLWCGLDQASIMGTELMSAILTWTGLGWLADRWLGTTPWLIVGGALVGNAAGLYLVWLRSGRMDGFGPSPAVASAGDVGRRPEGRP